LEQTDHAMLFQARQTSGDLYSEMEVSQLKVTSEVQLVED